MDKKQFFKSVFSETQTILEQFISNDTTMQQVLSAADIFVASLQKNHKIIACGNGGSMSDAMHFAEELTGRFRHDRKPFPAVAISDPAYLSCVANDYGYDNVFSRFVESFGQKGDVLLAISTSGNSANVINAAKVANEKQMKVIALSANDGGKLNPLSDVMVAVSHSGYSDRIQEIHIKVIHAWIQYIEEQLV